MSQIRDQYDDVSDFEDLLSLAESQAKTDWEMEFVSDLYGKYEKYGDGMFLSDKQRETLEKIAR